MRWLATVAMLPTLGRYVRRTLPPTSATGTVASPRGAGPDSRDPLAANWEPWQGQEKPSCAETKSTVHPWCGQIASHAVK